MSYIRRAACAALLVPVMLFAAPPASAGVGDLLVAPTRVILNGGRGTEIILDNIGEEVATYRVSLELRRMTADGMLHDVEEPSSAEQAAHDMIVYAPRRVTLAPKQPQSIRIAARAPKGLPDGEYRVHMLFRAVPAPRPAAAPKDFKGIGLALTPIYGVTIPIIVRLGKLEATAGISDVRVTREGGKPAISLALSRSGGRSTFGEVRVLKDGVKEPIAVQRGIAVYTELTQRSVTIPVDEKFASAASGSVTVQYVEPSEAGPMTIAEARVELR